MNKNDNRPLQIASIIIFRAITDVLPVNVVWMVGRADGWTQS